LDTFNWAPFAAGVVTNGAYRSLNPARCEQLEPRAGSRHSFRAERLTQPVSSAMSWPVAYTAELSVATMGGCRLPPPPLLPIAHKQHSVKRAKTGSARMSSKGKSSGIPPYDLRHAFASLQIRAGLPIPELAEQMGTRRR
jgi:integrase